MKSIFLLISILTLTGCFNTAEKMDTLMSSWHGRDVNDLIAEWGAPSSTLSDKKGGEIYVYDESSVTTIPGRSTSTSTYRYKDDKPYGTVRTTTTHTPPEQFKVKRQRMFWVDPDGKIYRWSWKGL